jgi:hypothetical protein
MPSNDEGWSEDRSLGATQSKKAGIVLLGVAAACILVAVWAFPKDALVGVYLICFTFGGTIGVIGIVLLQISWEGFAFTRCLGYYYREKTRPFKEVDEFIRDYLAGKFIEYDTKNERKFLYYISVSRDLCAFIRKRGIGDSETDFFGLRDVDGTKNDILADFRSKAIRALGLREGNIEYS